MQITLICENKDCIAPYKEIEKAIQSKWDKAMNAEKISRYGHCNEENIEAQKAYKFLDICFHVISFEEYVDELNTMIGEQFAGNNYHLVPALSIPSMTTMDWEVMRDFDSRQDLHSLMFCTPNNKIKMSIKSNVNMKQIDLKFVSTVEIQAKTINSNTDVKFVKDCWDDANIMPMLDNEFEEIVWFFNCCELLFDDDLTIDTF